MHRILPACLAVVLLGSPALVRAQSCQGFAGFLSTPVQVVGEASITSQSNAIGGGLSLGFPRGPFGRVSVANRTHDDFGGSSIDVAGATGYQIALGQGSRVHLCPLAGAALQLGPNGAFGSDVERLRQSAQVGMAVGVEMQSFPRWNIVPSFALSFAYQRDEAKDHTGSVLFQISDYYTLAQLAVGFVYRSTISVRPYLDLPLWVQAGEPTVGLSIGYGFGRRSH